VANRANNYRSGFVALIGRPNVGKSTLLNAMLGEKIAIISDKPQTTRNKIRAILSRGEGQIIFIDTPGIHKPKHKLGKHLVETALDTLKEVDLILWVVDASQPPAGGERFVADALSKVQTPVFLVVNKVDLINHDLQGMMSEYAKIGRFHKVFHISALFKQQIDILIDGIFQALPVGPQYYPEDQLTDQPERFIIAELVREKIFQLTHEEIPHSTAVEIEEIKERDNGLVYVRATIFVERESQKGIVVGKQGTLLKKIGKAAREDIEHLLGSKIYLDLWVKVKSDWRNQECTWRALGLMEE
jgi:GTP-binding protein Era